MTLRKVRKSSVEKGRKLVLRDKIFLASGLTMKDRVLTSTWQPAIIVPQIDGVLWTERRP